MKVAVDFDGTLADTIGIVCELLNFKRGTTLTPEQIDDWDYWSKNGLEEDFWAIYDMMDRTHLRRAIRPTSPWAAATVKWMESRGHEVEVVTSNSHTAAQEMQAWLFGHGLDCPVRAIGRGNDKANLDYNLFIDDAPGMAEDMAQHLHESKAMLLVDQPWNRTVKLPTLNVHRMLDWMGARWQIELLEHRIQR